MVFQNNILAGSSGSQDTTFSVDYSCRFNDNDSARLTRTNSGTPTDASKGVVGFWFKRANLGIATTLFDSEGQAYDMAFQAADNITSIDHAQTLYVTTQLFRDPSAWYHIVLSYDSDESTASDRNDLYVNGVKVTSFSTDGFSQTASTEAWALSQDSLDQQIGSSNNNLRHWDGYLAQYFLVDGKSIQNDDYALTDFGEFDDNGVWRPVDVSELTFGTNGYLLDFADSSDLGNDVSGNNNDWTSSGLAAGDQMEDTPTKNFCTLNPLDTFTSVGAHTLSEGNLKFVHTNSGGSSGTMVMTGKSYWEVTCNVTVDSYVGIINNSADTGASAQAQSITGDHDGFVNYIRSGAVYKGDTQVDTYATWASGDVMGCAYDPTVPDIEFFKNNASQGSITLDDLDDYQPWIGAAANTASLTCNFGATAFAYTPPAGFKAINTANLTTPTIPDGTAHFQTTLYTGNGSARNIDQTENSTFQPDFVWLKNVTDGGSNNMLIDAARGVTKVLATQLTAVEATDANSLTSFDSDGFGLGTGAAGIAGGYNINTKSYFAYQWLAGGGAGSSNTAGTINTTTTTVNTTAGISIGTYTGTGSAATIGHGLGAVPKLIIVKERTNDVGSWFMYHADMSDDPETDYMLLDSFSAIVDDATVWNDTAPTSTVFSIGTHDDVNGSSDTYVYYAFAEVLGFSSFGSYIGNGSLDGPFVYTGFKTSFITYKDTASAIWPIFDSARNPINVVQASRTQSFINYNASPQTYGYGSDFLSNGFKLRNTDGQANADGHKYLYITFAEYPFGGEDVTPATAF